MLISIQEVLLTQARVIPVGKDEISPEIQYHKKTNVMLEAPTESIMTSQEYTFSSTGFVALQCKRVLL